MSNHPLLNIAIRAARQAGNVIARNIDRFDAFTVVEKAQNDFVTEIDRAAERRIIDSIRKSHPDHAFLAEESGAHGHGDFEWIIDPLDGTANFVHGFPHVAVSIAVRRRGRLEHAVVFDPLRQELFTASRGSGARLDDRRIRVAARSSLKGALLGSGFPFREFDRLESCLATLKALTSAAAQTRRSGSAALDLAYVAAGRLDGFWQSGLAPWDIAAGALLVQEAGGIVAEPDGGDDYLRSGAVVAANPKVLRAMLPHVRHGRTAPAETGKPRPRAAIHPGTTSLDRPPATEGGQERTTARTKPAPSRKRVGTTPLDRPPATEGGQERTTARTKPAPSRKRVGTTPLDRPPVTEDGQERTTARTEPAPSRKRPETTPLDRPPATEGGQERTTARAEPAPSRKRVSRPPRPGRIAPIRPPGSERAPGPDATLPITLVPSPAEVFRKALIRTKQAWIVVTYRDGREEVRRWRAPRISATSNIIGNLRNRPEFRTGAWQRNGIAGVQVSIERP